MPEVIKARYDSGEVTVDEENGKETKVMTDIEATVELGSDLNDAVARFGEGLVFSLFRKQATVEAQNAMRRHGLSDIEPEDLQARMDAWKPGDKAERVVNKEAFETWFSRKSPDEQQTIMQGLRDKAEAAAAGATA